MKDGGYSAQFRKGVLECGVKGYNKQVQRDKDGVCPLYRPKGYLSEERYRKKEIRKMASYKPFDPVLFCPPTPNSKLAKDFRKIAEDTYNRFPLELVKPAVKIKPS